MANPINIGTITDQVTTISTTWGQGINDWVWAAYQGILNLTGGQIKFPATQSASADANTLDDYEEATLTPVLNLGGATTGITYGTQTGTQTKIGDRVFFDFNIVLTSKGSATGAATITGLTVAAASRAEAVINVTGVSLSTTDIPQAYITSTTIALVYTDITTGGVNSITDAALSGTATIRISGHYKA